MKYFKINILIGFIFIIIGGCGGAKAEKTVKDPKVLDDSKSVIALFIKDNGYELTAHEKSPENINEVFEIIKKDDISRFGAASKYVESLTGADSLYLRGMFDLSYGGLQQIAAYTLKDKGNKKLAEANRLAAMELSGFELDSNQLQSKKEFEEESKKITEVEAALEKVSYEKIISGFNLANEMVRLYPEDSRGFVLRAYANRLKRDWSGFSEAISKAERLDKNGDENIRYQRIMEKLQRFRLKNEAEEDLIALRDELPKRVRIQAILVLNAREIEESHNELSKLRDVSPNHLIVQLLGKTIDQEYEIFQSLNKAKEGDIDPSDSDSGIVSDTETSTDTATDSPSEQ
ncbi:MAG: hypothetical protein JXR91_14705 [Deltaproteobacteria bacterium]|nr:hypothetical protein [Deltaproteobacteria bacterium]